MHIQFPQDMCITFVFYFSDLYGAYAYIFNSREICVQVALIILIHEDVLGVIFIGGINLLRSVGDI